MAAPSCTGEEAGNATEGSAEAKKPTTVAQEQSAGGEVAALDTNSSGLAARDASAAGGQEAAAAGQLHGGCQDLEEGCPEWAAEDGCIHHGPSFMLERCRKSCGVCGQPYLMQVPANVSTRPPILQLLQTLSPDLLSTATGHLLRMSSTCHPCHHQQACVSPVLETGCGSCLALSSSAGELGLCSECTLLMRAPVLFLVQVTLGNGVEMPRVGFGTAGLGLATEEATAWALASGYRLLDSAQVPTHPGAVDSLLCFTGRFRVLKIRWVDQSVPADLTREGVILCRHRSGTGRIWWGRRCSSLGCPGRRSSSPPSCTPGGAAL